MIPAANRPRTSRTARPTGSDLARLLQTGIYERSQERSSYGHSVRRIDRPRAMVELRNREEQSIAVVDHVRACVADAMELRLEARVLWGSEFESLGDIPDT
jgi:hypothetical protein